jgi:hypothetical protein
MSLIDQAEVSLVHEGCRLESPARPLAREPLPGHVVELAVEDFDQPLAGQCVARAPGAQKKRHLLGTDLWCLWRQANILA